jgi:hypothetical protein
MIKKMISTLTDTLGYQSNSIPPVEAGNGFELYQYLKPDGAFDYEQYRQIQTTGNRRKIDNVWVIEENIAFLSDYIKKNASRISFGLCHGTRRGMEQAWFSKYLNCDVLGTEISDTASTFPSTIRWDFHEVKDEWIGAVDFVYSNSFDHSYDPQKCLNAWMSCVKQNGICILEHTSGHERATELDPFGADISQMPYLILNWGAGKYCVREILNAPAKPDSLKYIQYMIIGNL